MTMELIATKPVVTEAQIIQYRDKPYRVTVLCPICDEPMRKDSEISYTRSGRKAHTVCVGVEGEFDICLDCFMIVSQCNC